MTKTATVYGVAGCPTCVRTKAALAALGYAVTERDGTALAAGHIRDRVAMAELMLTEVYPVVIVDGRAVREGDELYNLIQECAI